MVHIVRYVAESVISTTERRFGDLFRVKEYVKKMEIWPRTILWNLPSYPRR
ncbi:MAG: hypothetical protein ACE5QW_07975 [Thermoplasmata archaeon]